MLATKTFAQRYPFWMDAKTMRGLIAESQYRIAIRRAARRTT